MRTRRSFLRLLAGVVVAPFVKIVKADEPPAAISIPNAKTPTVPMIGGTRFKVKFDRIVTPRFIKDQDHLVSVFGPPADPQLAEQIKQMLEKARSSPKGWHVLPFPVEYTPIG